MIPDKGVEPSEDDVRVAYLLLHYRPTVRRGVGGQTITQSDRLREMTNGWLEQHLAATKEALRRIREENRRD